jgi:hypothetical protein
MASATSKVAPVKVSEKQGKASLKSVQNYYNTQVTTLADGSVKRETYRTDANGNNSVKISEVTADKDGKITNDTTLSTATDGEKKALSNPNSQLRQSIITQTKEAGDKAKANLIDPGGDKASKVAGGESGNDAENDNDATNESKPTEGGDEGTAAAEGTRTQFPTLIHPADLGTSKQDVIRFDMHEYVPGELSGTNLGNGIQGFGFNSGTNNLGPSIGSVTLPIPSGITDQNKADWGSNSMTALDIAKAEVAKTAIFNGLGEGAEKFMDYVKEIGENSGEVKTAVGTALAASAAGVDGQALLARTTGMVMNPNMELLFKGPTLRPFSFKFKLSPRGKKEAENIIKIIRFFKQGSAPIRSESNLFLKSPHIFKITYIHRGEQGELHKKLNAFKTCALQGFGVNYTPTGNYTTYQDGTMVAYDISMNFTEIVPIFNDDYDMDDTFIGF